ncbi:MAG: DMT family transporter [Verrucomicrobiales bacterium]
MHDPSQDDRDHLAGIGLVAAGALCWSTAGVAVRGISVDPWQITFWRSFFMVIAVSPAIWARRRRLADEVRSAGWAMLASGTLLGAAFVCFILAVAHTPVANVLFLMACAPLLTTVIARIFFGESVALRTWVAIGAAGGGVAIMVGDSMRADGVFGLALALAVALCFSVNANLVRRFRRVSMVPSVFLAGVVSMAATAPWAFPASAGPRDFALLAFLGFVQLGLGMMLYMAGARRVSAPQAMIVSLLEMVFGPVWVWLAFGETASAWALAGGAVVLIAVAADTWLGARAGRRSGIPPAPLPPMAD